MSEDLELSFKITEEEKERIKKILLGNGGVRHYLLKIADGTELDVVDYKDYQKLEEELDAHSKGLCEAVKDKNKLQEKIDKLYIDKENLINYLEGAIEYEKTGLLWTSKKRLKVYQEILDIVKNRRKEK